MPIERVALSVATARLCLCRVLDQDGEPEPMARISQNLHRNKDVIRPCLAE